MGLNTRFSLEDNKKKIIIGLLIVLVCLIIGICIYMNTRTVNQPNDTTEPDRTLVVDNNPLPEEPPVVEQDDIVSQLKAKITNVIDYSTKIEYQIEINVGDEVKTSLLKATTNTLFVDLVNKKIINPSEVTKGSDIILYATGKYEIGDLSAQIIGIGDDTSYNFGKLTAINTNDSNSYIWTLDNMSERVLVSLDTLLIDGYSGEEIENLKIPQVNDKFLFKGSIQETNIGSVYVCDELIRLGK